MKEIRKILVPTDFSEHGTVALEAAILMARTFGAELVIAHVMPPPIYPLSMSVGAVSFPPMEAEVRKYAEQKIAEIQRDLPDELVSHSVVREGTPFVELVRLAREEHVDLLVISTHGYSGIKHALLGSTTERIVRKAPCPVLTIRPDDADFELP